MSVLETTAPGMAARAARMARPLLSLVPRAASRAPRMPFVLLVVLVLGGGLVGLLLVNTSLQQGAFTVHELERRSAVLSDQRQRLSEALATLEAPATLAGRARALGMVPMTGPVFLRLRDGKVLGSPAPAQPLAADSPMRGVVPLRDSATVTTAQPAPAAAAAKHDPRRPHRTASARTPPKVTKHRKPHRKRPMAASSTSRPSTTATSPGTGGRRR